MKHLGKIGDTIGDLEDDIDVLLAGSHDYDVIAIAVDIRERLLAIGLREDILDPIEASSFREEILNIAEQAESYLHEDISARMNSRPLVQDQAA